jgi:uncharacterized membrane protein (DUF2068 family)
MNQEDSAAALRTIALLEGAKGLLVLLVGYGFFALIHHDLHSAAAELVRHLHLNPAGHYPRIFLDLADRVSDGELWLLAASALFYALLRLVEAYGLWQQRLWAQWFGVISSGLYLPLEIYETVTAFSWANGVILVVNLCVVLTLARTLRQRAPANLSP